MGFFKLASFFVLLAAAAVGVWSAPSAGGYIWSSWTDGKAKITQKNGPNGQYSVKWSGDKGNFVIGKGWNPGGPRDIPYSGTFKPVGNGYLSVYGWTTNPLVEYYIVECYGTHKPSDTPEAVMKGNMTSGGGVYELMTKKRINKPSIIGTATFDQYFAIRVDRRVGGTISTGDFFKAWEDVGLKMGKHNEMIVAVEGQDSSGEADITVGVAPAAGASTAVSLPVPIITYTPTGAPTGAPAPAPAKSTRTPIPFPPAKSSSAASMSSKASAPVATTSSAASTTPAIPTTPATPAPSATTTAV